MKQYTLGMLINRLEEIEFLDDDNEPKLVRFDFSGCYPTGLSSWRGDYSHLSINFDCDTLSYYGTRELKEKLSIEVFLKKLKKAVGKTYEGWKGGNFVMDEDTPLWVDNDGFAEETVITSVKDCGWYVVLCTSHKKY